VKPKDRVKLNEYGRRLGIRGGKGLATVVEISGADAPRAWVGVLWDQLGNTLYYSPLAFDVVEPKGES
jgi:hypothetical protein